MDLEDEMVIQDRDDDEMPAVIEEVSDERLARWDGEDLPREVQAFFALEAENKWLWEKEDEEGGYARGLHGRRDSISSSSSGWSCADGSVFDEL